MLLQAALNGRYTTDTHPALPESIEQLARDAVACVAAGARAIHLHPRDGAGREQLDAQIVDAVARDVRAACGVPVGVTTGAWIEPDPDRRLAYIRAWRAPDYASVNLSEPGATAIMAALLENGIGVEAGVWTVLDAELLGESGFGPQVTRILVEVGEQQAGGDVAAALRSVEQIHVTLDRLGLAVPRLQHGDGRVAWPVLVDAIRRGIDTRVGLEDTLYQPGGELTTGNAALVRAAREHFGNEQ